MQFVFLKKVNLTFLFILIELLPIDIKILNSPPLILQVASHSSKAYLIKIIELNNQL